MAGKKDFRIVALSKIPKLTFPYDKTRKYLVLDDDDNTYPALILRVAGRVHCIYYIYITIYCI